MKSKGKNETEGARFGGRDRKTYGKRKKRRKVSAGLGAEGKNREWTAKGKERQPGEMERELSKVASERLKE